MVQKSEEETGSPANAAIQGALAALKRGDKSTAQGLARQAADLAPESEAPWLILAALSGPEESVIYALKALQINPESPRARQALAWAQSRLSEKPLAAAPKEPAEPAHPEGSPAVIPAAVPAESNAAPAEETIPQAGPAATPAPAAEALAAPLPEEAPPVAMREPAPAESAVPRQEAAHPAAPPQGRKKSAPARSARWLVVLAILVIVALVVAGIIFLPRLLAGLSPQAGCSPSLVLGAQTFAVEKINPGSSATLPAPASAAGRAYWVEGTLNNAVFLLSPVPDNLGLVNALKTGDTALFTQANCNQTSYSLSTFTPSEPLKADLLDQSVSQITIYMPPGAGSTGLVVVGQLREENIISFSTPDASSVQVEVSLLETTTSPDKATITVSVSINNYGQTAATLSPGDVSLAPEGATPLKPFLAEPALPFTIKPGATETIQLTFPRPATPTATLKIFTVEYTLEGY